MAALIATSSVARADCTPASADNVIATCSGATTNQGGGAPGTSAGADGYGTAAEAGVTVNVTAGSGNTITGTNYGISLAGNATVTNNAGASIMGGDRGIFAASATIINSGSIIGTVSRGIYTTGAMTLTNNAGAVITGGLFGTVNAAGSINVTNSGSITGTGNSGVRGALNATVTNAVGADITGGQYGIYVGQGFATVTNSGSITGTSQMGIRTITNTATVTNNAGASITGGQFGVYSGGSTSFVVNAGAISSGQYGIYGGASGGSSVFNSGTISGGTAAIWFAGTGNTLTLAQGSVITGNVLGTGNDTLQLGGTGSATFDVSQIGAAAQYQGFGTFNKIDSSTWTLTGTSTYAGPINVNGGTLSVSGNVASASLVTVNSGSALSGTGTVGNTSVIGGTFAPGSGTPGSSMTVTGTLGLDAASTYVVYVNPTTASLANVSGAATLGGATVSANFAAGSYIAKQYTILTASSINGPFGTLTNSNLPSNFHDTLSYDATHAYLNLALNFATPAPGGLNSNQNNVANALINYFNTTGGIPAVFGTLNANGLSQASGQPGASSAQPGITATGQFVNAIFDGAFDDNGQGGAVGFAADDDAANAYAAKRKVPREAKEAYAAVTPRDRARAFDARWNVWASVYGGNSRVNGDASAGTSTTTSRIFGAVAGASYRATPNTQLGFALGGAGSSFGLDGGFGGGKADIFNAAVYAKHNIGAAYVAGALSYSWQDTTTDRTVTISGTDQLHASFKAQALAARLESGWRYATPVVGITPYGALQSTSFYLPSYGETATSGSNTFALNYASKSVTATRSELGAKFDKAMLVQGGVFTLKAKTAWAHDWNTDRSATATFQTLPGATFTTNGAQPSANAALLSLGGEMGWHNGWTLAANFDGEFSRTTAGYAGKGSVRYAW